MIRPVTRTHHPSRRIGRRAAQPAAPARHPTLMPDPVPRDRAEATLEIGGRAVRLTHLRKVFWPAEGLTKADLLGYYARLSPVLLPHLLDRAMVMKRYPNGIAGKFFFMKRTPRQRPAWLTRCSIAHPSGSVIEFPVVDDLASLLWVVNLGCIDLNPWYARCDDVDRPDSLQFDLDPTPGARFEQVLDAALFVREALEALGMPAFAKTTGSRGLHVSVPIVRGPTQQDVWRFAKEIARELAARAPRVLTSEYRLARRPRTRVLIDYNQNAWGRTLAAAYSVRPRPCAPVSAPVAWEEVERGLRIEDFRIDNMAGRVAAVGDLWHPLAARSGRFDLRRFL
jgi:bifunctional non-homologous end joining protein LigD